MGRVGEVITRTWQTADKMKRQRGRLAGGARRQRQRPDPALRGQVHDQPGHRPRHRARDRLGGGGQARRPGALEAGLLRRQAGAGASRAASSPGRRWATPTPPSRPRSRSSMRPMFGGFGRATGATSVAFVSRLALETGTVRRLRAHQAARGGARLPRHRQARHEAQRRPAADRRRSRRPTRSAPTASCCAATRRSGCRWRSGTSSSEPCRHDPLAPAPARRLGASHRRLRPLRRAGGGRAARAGPRRRRPGGGPGGDRSGSLATSSLPFACRGPRATPVRLDGARSALRCDASRGHVANRASRAQGQASSGRPRPRVRPAGGGAGAPGSGAAHLPGHLAPVFGAVLRALGVARGGRARLFLLPARCAASCRPPCGSGVVGPLEAQALLAAARPVAAERAPGRDAPSSLGEDAGTDRAAPRPAAGHTRTGSTRAVPELKRGPRTMHATIASSTTGPCAPRAPPPRRPRAPSRPGLVRRARDAPAAAISTGGRSRSGVGGPVGSGKTALVLALCRALRDRCSPRPS